VIFYTLDTVRYYMAKTETTTGLEVKVSILEKVYATGRKCTAGFKLLFDSCGSVFDVTPLVVGLGSYRSPNPGATPTLDHP
jgi:hypothetical protein